jgi:hypothetical protein
MYVFVLAIYLPNHFTNELAILKFKINETKLFIYRVESL